MKEKIKNTLAITAIASILLSVIAQFYGGCAVYINSIYQIFGVCVIIEIGTLFLEHFESRYFLIENVVEIGMILVVVLCGGYLFDWYNHLPVWIVVFIGVIVYVAGCFIDTFRIRNDINVINSILKKERDK